MLRQLIDTFLCLDCVYLGSRRSHSREVPRRTQSSNVRLIRPGAAQQGSGGASNKCFSVCVSSWFSILSSQLNHRDDLPPQSHLFVMEPLCLCLPLQIDGQSVEQELFNCVLLPGFHHASVLPAQQDCVRHGSWYYCC